VPRSTFVLDFDRTVADTFIPSPNGFGVEKNYELSIEELFGPGVLALYRSQGGLRNRSPSEVVAELGVGRDHDETVMLTEELVRVRLARNLSEIGRPMANGCIWPPLCTGFAEFWWEVRKLTQCGHIRTAIVSSGARIFIEATFRTHGLEPPAVIVTDDDMRARPDIPVDQRSKPATPILDLAIRRLGLTDRSSVIYFGDDLVKDGGLASNAGVPFGYFNTRADSFAETTSGFEFNDWCQVIDHLPGLLFG